MRHRVFRPSQDGGDPRPRFTLRGPSNVGSLSDFPGKTLSLFPLFPGIHSSHLATPVHRKRTFAREYMDSIESSRSLPRRARKHKASLQKPKEDPDAWVQKIALPALEGKDGGIPVGLDFIEKLSVGQRVPRLTSPRSIKACLDLGVDPKQLAAVNMEDFRNDKVDTGIWMLQYQHAADLREKLLEKLNNRRSQIESDAVVKQFRPGKSGGGTEDALAAAESTTVQKATERIERLQEKQRRLAAQQLEALNESIQLQKTLEAKIERVDGMMARKKEDMRMAEKTRIDNMYKGTMQAAAAARQAELDRRREMSEQYKREEAERAAEKRRQQELKQQAKEAAERQAEKEREFKRRHLAILAEQEAAIDAKRRAMEAEDRRREKLKKAQEAERAEAIAATAAEFQQRLNKAKSAADSNEDGRRNELLDREAKAEHRRRVMEEERAQERQLEAARNREKEEMRRLTKVEADRLQEVRVSKIVAEAEEAERKLEKLRKEQEFKRQLTVTERNLLVSDRKMRTEMQKKQDALYRFTLKQKVDRDNAKAEFIKDMKDRMRRRAIQANIDASMARTKQAEESAKMLHASYRAAAAPKLIARRGGRETM